MSILDEVPAIVAEATGGDTLPALVISRSTQGPVDTTTGTRPAATVATLTANGVRSEYSLWVKAQKLVGEKSVKILVIAGTIKAADGSPGIVEEEDVIAIGGERFRVIKISKDPANATFSCECVGWFEE